MARARLEDLNGTINTVFFPETYEKSAGLLRGEEPLFLKGTVVGEGDLRELHVQEAIPLDTVWDRRTIRLALQLEAAAVTKERLGSLRGILDHVPGPVPVNVELLLPSGAQAVLQLRRHRVAVGPELIGEIDALFEHPVTRCCLA